ncbi:ABC transporter permease [Acidipila sp. EB88]|uniref:ABC transporter permease n=1 Tax=Acidipila sp. EB88 TaxID=2305226 RepID=UPI000F5FBADE|nr:ABC transporter permease [Acidipila sp. EB88]RRA48294.1 ABC transporter permease [Acidipila sp. EB88]
MNRSNVRETLAMALDSLRANRMRSLLTILGVVIGVATVIIISSIITGLNNKVQVFADSFGSNAIWAFHMPIDVQPTAELLARKRLTVEEALSMRSLPHVVSVNPSIRYQDPQYGVGEESVKYNGKSVQNTILEGDTDQVSSTSNLPLVAGAMFNDEQNEHRANVVVLGADTTSKLFGGTNAIGAEVTIRGEIFTVVGTLGKVAGLFGSGPNPNDNIAYMPLNTFRKLLPGQKDLGIAVRYDEAKNEALVEDEVRTVLRIARRVPTQKDDDFAVFTPEAIVRLWGQITGGLVLFMIAVSSVGLMVGGVGVMNIMLVSVTERTREIGVRKAIGATRNGILLQFTAEAVTLCAVGGILGVALGGLVTLAIRLSIAALPASMSTLWTVVSFSTSCMIGLVFGIYPAWKAATLNPIEALRYE